MSHNLSGAVQWFRECQTDNSRDFWTANRERYKTDVRSPLVGLIESAGEPVDSWRIYRPHRDIRFSPNSPPLKEFLGALCVADDGTGRYVQVDGEGLLASSGLPYFAPDQLLRWRAAVDSRSGLDGVLATVTSNGLTVRSGYPAPTKRVPHGFDPEHPLALYLRWKGIEAFTRRVQVARVNDEWLREAWASAGALTAWLAANVGRSCVERPRR